MLLTNNLKACYIQKKISTQLTRVLIMCKKDRHIKGSLGGQYFLPLKSFLKLLVFKRGDLIGKKRISNRI